ncbi:MAG: serine hydrolase domain-containing protein [Promethearchaeota archaeon]|jgi:CubicO group peptidase (beta-lactamase class C family)
MINEYYSEKVDKLFKQWDKPDSPGCALGIVKHGDIIYKKGYGMANLEYGIPITPQTVFNMGSISKQFTAFSILLLEKEGKLSLEDKIHSYLPYLPHFGKKITIQHLLNHTSGLREERELLMMSGWRDDHFVTQSDILNIVKRQHELNFEPGSEYLYSNTGYTLLAEIVKTVSGMEFTDFTDLHIFKPLGMEKTHFRRSHQQIVKNCASPYRSISIHGVEKSVLSFVTVGPRGLLSTVEDLAKWDKNFYSGKVGGLDVVKKMIQKGVLNNGKKIEYANGLNILKYRGLHTVEHGGGNPGFHSFFLRFPSHQITIICLGNFGEFPAAFKSFRVADIILEKKLEKKSEKKPEEEISQITINSGEKDNRKKLSHEKLLEYTGKYFSDELSCTYECRIKRDRLIFKSPGSKPNRIFYIGNDLFRRFKSVMNIIKFTRDEKNDVVGFEISGMRVRNLRFDRII